MQSASDHFTSTVLNDLKACASNGRAVLSLDLFDTLLYRTVKNPVDVFLAAGIKLKEQEKIRFSPQIFADRRRFAEVQARTLRFKQQGHYEVCLSEIYDCFPQPLDDLSAAEMIEAELQADSDTLQLDQRLNALCREAASGGAELILTSDTYYTRSNLEHLLKASGFDSSMLSAIWNSCQEQLSKSSGLFAKLLHSMSIAPQQMLHIGDNPQSDIAAAKALGIRTRHYPTFAEHQPGICRQEEILYQASAPPAHRHNYDAGLNALRARLLTNIGFSYAPNRLKSEQWLFGALSLGPALAGFSQWLIKRQAELGGALCFVSREGPFLADLVRRCGSCRAHLPSISLLQTSRVALARASLISGTHDELELVLSHRITPLTPATFAKLFELSVCELGIPQFLWHCPLREKRLIDFLELVLENGVLLERLLQASGSARARLMAHFEQQLSEADKALAAEKGLIIVDLGWTGHSHSLLGRILKHERPGIRLRGLYFGLEDQAFTAMNHGEVLEGFLFNPGLTTGVDKQSLRCKEIIEQTALFNSGGSTVDFNELGAPIRTPALLAPSGVRYTLAQIREGISAFFQEYLLQTPSGRRNSLSSESAIPALRTVYSRPLLLPSKAEKQFLSQILHDENDNTKSKKQIVESFEVSLAQYLPLRQLLYLPFYWPIGALANARPEMLPALLSTCNNLSEPWLINQPDSHKTRCVLTSFSIRAACARRLKDSIHTAPMIFEADSYGAVQLSFFTSSPIIVAWQVTGRSAQVVLDKAIVLLRNTRTGSRQALEFKRGDSAKQWLKVAAEPVFAEESFELSLRGVDFQDPVGVNLFLCGIITPKPETLRLRAPATVEHHALARVSHQPPADSPHLAGSAEFSALGDLDVFQYDFAHQDPKTQHLQRPATSQLEVGEKCGLECSVGTELQAGRNG